MKKALLLIIALLGLLAAVLTAPAQESFGITNVCTNTVAIQQWPTNSTGLTTGRPINVANQERCGFYFTGVPQMTNDVAFTVQLVRSHAAGPPVVTVDAGGRISRNDWELAGTPITFIFTNLPSYTTPTNACTWFTNLDVSFLAGANWLGVFQVTNRAGSSQWTNIDCGLVKKIIPIRYP